MSANFLFKRSEKLFPIHGVSLGIAEAGIKKPDRKDLLIIVLEKEVRVSGVFTKNRFCAAPVIVAKEHLLKSSPEFPIRALIINTGSANAGTGEEGITNARSICRELAGLLNCNEKQILPFSTGVIMELLPLERIISSLPAAVANLNPNNWFAAAQAIMTTDIVPKVESKQILLSGTVVTVTGIAKGSGMIHPNMATMLSYIATDAALSQPLLNELIGYAADNSFNRITVDGDTSTNDAFILIATGRANNPEIVDKASSEFKVLRETVTEVALLLAKAIVRDGEGATKFITVKVEGGKVIDECEKVAFSIAHSPLVKTAFFASDPNLGRILAAVGYAGINDLDVSSLLIYLDDVLVVENGGRASSYSEQEGKRVMQQPEVTVRIVLNRGKALATVWTCDFSYDYVKINSEYRS